jgi:hypothetical protein
MAGEPNELPEGGEGGGGVFRPRPGINELPQFLTSTSIAGQGMLLQEILNLRGRLHQLENAHIIQGATGRSFAGAALNPAELPEGGEGGGGFGGGVFGEFPGEFPGELPADRFAALESQMSQLTVAVSQLVAQVNQIKG